MPNDRRNKQILPGATIYILATVASVTPNMVLALPQAEGKPPQDHINVSPAAVLIAGDGVELVLPDPPTTSTPPPEPGTSTTTTEAPKTGTQASEDFLRGRADGLKGNHDSGPTSDDYDAGFAEGAELREQEGRAETPTSATEPPAEDTSAA